MAARWRRLGDLLEHVVGVGEPDEQRLVGTGRHRHALGEHGVEERGVAGLVGALGAGEVDGRGVVAAIHPEQRTDDRELGREPGRRAGLGHHRRQASGAPVSSV